MLGAGMGDHLGGPGVKHYTVGCVAGEGEGAHVGNFPKPSVQGSSVWGLNLGGRGSSAETSFSRGDTPHFSRRGPTEQGMCLFSPATQKADIANRSSKSLPEGTSSASQPLAPGNSNLKKISPSKTPLARVWD